MENLKTARPASVTAISWACISFGVIDLLQMLFPLLLKHISKIKSPDVSIQALFMNAHWLEVTLTQTLLCLLMILCGVFFLKAKTWARIGIEATAWVWLIILFGTFWFTAQEIIVLARTAQPGMPIYPHIIGIFRSSLFTLIFITALIFIIKWLHAEPVKTYLNSSTPKG
jgi:hypothetical protein